jgi:hypothetical protein
MKLAAFIQSLLKEGRVTIEGQLISFEKDDLQAAGETLKKYYEEDIVEMHGTAPDFSEQAAIWAAQYFYHAVQLTMLRDADEGTIEATLNSFEGNIGPAEIYSVDLMFRYLPALFNLAKGLSPADVLVTSLEKTAADWPFSSVGIGINNFSNNKNVFSNSSLTYAYTDRIIKHKDLKRAADPAVAEYIREALGAHTSLWPGFNTDYKKTE